MIRAIMLVSFALGGCSARKEISSDYSAVWVSGGEVLISNSEDEVVVHPFVSKYTKYENLIIGFRRYKKEAIDIGQYFVVDTENENISTFNEEDMMEYLNNRGVPEYVRIGIVKYDPCRFQLACIYVPQLYLRLVY